MSNIWNLILTSNAFNFAIFLLILIVIAKSFNLSEIPAKMRQTIKKRISESEDAKISGENKFKNAQKSYSDLKSEITTLMDSAQKNAVQYREAIFEDTTAKLKNIELNIQKIIDAEEKIACHQVTSSHAVKSVIRAKELIIAELEQNKDLHKKFLDESIKEISEVFL